MDPGAELRKVVTHLNREGGFFNSLQFDRIAEAAAGLPWPVVDKAIKSCVESRDFILDHTHFVCSELEKERLAPSGAVGDAAGDAAFSEQEEELWHRIGWMNTEGGFENTLRYEDVSAAAKGVENSAVMLVLAHLEEKWQEVNDPTSWVCAALHKKRNGKGVVKGAPIKGQELGKGQEPSKGQEPPQQPGKGQEPALASSEQPAQASPPAEADGGVRERVAWLNGQGGLQSPIKYDQIAAVAAGLDPAVVMKVLSHLADKRGDVNDPTSWVCGALLKEQRGGKGWQKGGGVWVDPGQQQQQLPQQPRQPQQPWQGGGEQNLDRELRRRIAFLNNEGGFQNTITYREVSDAAAGLDVPRVMQIFAHLEEKRAEITNPTHWVCAALWKERGGKGGGKAPPAHVPSGKGNGKGSGARLPPVPPPPVQKTMLKR